MNQDNPHLSERLLQAVVELGALPVSGTDADSLAEEILRVCLLLPGVSAARLLLPTGDEVVQHSIRRRPALFSTERVLSELLAPLAGLRTPVHRTDPSEGSLAALLADAPQPPAWIQAAPVPRTIGGEPGVLLVEGESDADPASLRLLPLLARHAATLLDQRTAIGALDLEARTDGLTGIFNYRHFMEALYKEIKRADRFGERFTVLMIDVDNLKQYNDAHGHLGGSGALRDMAELLRNGAREIDVVAKYGGDEFSVLLPNTAREGALCFARRVLEDIRQHPFEGDADRRLTVSVGIAEYPADGADEKSLLAAADQRLYHAKTEGRDRLCADLPEVTTS